MPEVISREVAPETFQALKVADVAGFAGVALVEVYRIYKDKEQKHNQGACQCLN